MIKNILKYEDVMEKVLNKNRIIYVPNVEIYHTAIPYLISLFNASLTRNLTNVDKNKDIILYNFTFPWQSFEWINILKKEQEIIIGGIGTILFKEKLPKKDNVYIYTKKLPIIEHKIIPDYKAIIDYNPFIEFLMVYSGDGCHWSKCKFCYYRNNERIEENTKYVSECILSVNRSNKLAGLSCPCHSLEWLLELEKKLPKDDSRRYWAYVRATDGLDLLKHSLDLYIGSEYLSDSVLNRINKGLSSDLIMSTILKVLKSGTNVWTNIIEDLYNTDDELKEHHRNKLVLLEKARDIFSSGGGRLYMTCNLLQGNYSI